MVKQIALSMEVIDETLKPLCKRSSGRLLLLALNFKTRRSPKAGVFLNPKVNKNYAGKHVTKKLLLKKCHVRFIFHFHLAAEDYIWGKAIILL